MFVKQYAYKNLSRSSIYRHIAEGKRRRLNNELNDGMDVSLHDRVEELENHTEASDAESHNENAENKLYCEAQNHEADIDSDRGYDNADDESSSQNSEALSAGSNLGDFGSVFSNEDEAIDHDNMSNSDDDGDGDGDGGDEENDGDPLDEPLYPGARITIGESLTTILLLHLRHSQSDTHLSDLLEIIEKHCPANNKCPKTLYFLRKWLGNSEVKIQKHFFCSACFMELNSADEVCPACPDPKTTTYFISIPLDSQLQELFKRPGFYDSLDYRFHRQKENDYNFEDIYDGNVYRSFCIDGASIDLRLKSNVSFTWNSDGVPLYKSSKFSIWPQYLMINELSPEDRKKTSNMLVAGIWFGPKKPVANLFLEPLTNDLRQLRKGILLYIYDLDRAVNIKAITLCCTCDLPAKALFLNMKQYNARYGCHKCKIETLDVDKRRSYQQVNNLKTRTTEETELFAERAVNARCSVYGVKGPTLMSLFLPDCIRNNVIDAMHLLTGVSKLLFKIWLHSDYKNHPASIRDNFDTIRNRICSITPPSSIPRLPRSIYDFAYWKASELITWLLMYSTIVLHGIMSEEFFSHHTLLVHGIYLLYQRSVTVNNINNARLLLHKYVNNFGDLYGVEFMSCNIHSLLHLAELVEDYGPLWVFTCFPFENANGILKALVHATRDAQIQICQGVSVYLTLEGLKKKYIRRGSECEILYNGIEKKGIHRSKLQYIYHGIAIVGVAKKFGNIPRDIQLILTHFGYNQRSVYNFHCLIKDGVFYSSKLYARRTRTDSTCVLFTYGNEECIGFIEQFLRLSNCTCKNSVCENCINESETLVIIKKCRKRHIFSTLNPRTTLNFIHRLELDNERDTIIINVSELKTVYLQIVTPGTSEIYAVKPLSL